jgi:Sap-like sulfolipid-1-addressing protein
VSAAVASTLVLGLVVGITPWAIVIVLVLLEATRGLVVAWAFVVGWAAAIAAIGGAVVFGLGTVASGTEAEGNVTLALALAIGVVLLAYGLRRLLLRRGTGDGMAPPAPEEPSIPRWLGALEELRPVYAFALGVFWLNYPFVILWGGEVVHANLTSTAYAVLLCCFVALGSSGVAGLAGYATIAPVRAAPVVTGFRGWMTRNAGAIVTGLALAVGGVLAARGLAGLL